MNNNRPQIFNEYTIVTVAFIMMMIMWGTFNSFGVFFESLIKEFGWTRAITSGASSMNNVIFGILCVFSAGLSERLGHHRVMAACGLILGLSYFLMARLTSTWELYLYYGFFMAFGMSPYIPLLSLIPKYFARNRGRMNAIVLSGMGLGIMIIPPLASRLISIWQWRNAYLVIALITPIIMVAASQFLKKLPKGPLHDSHSSLAIQSAAGNDEGLTFCQAVQTKQFALLCILYFSFLFCLIAILVHIVIHATGRSIPVAHAAFTLSLIGGTCIVGMNVMGNLADRLSNRTALSISYTLMGLSFVWLIPADSEGAFYLFSIVFGFAYGGMQVLFSPLVAELFGTRSHGVILAAGALVGSIGAAIGPIVAGYIFDTRGSYNIAFIICAILAFTGLASTFLLRKETLA